MMRAASVARSPVIGAKLGGSSVEGVVDVVVGGVVVVRVVDGAVTDIGGMISAWIVVVGAIVVGTDGSEVGNKATVVVVDAEDDEVG